ncbi:MAG: hypothetical protein WBF13_05570, partial [Candidatus Zixiibacteriota bacterium]
MIAALLSDKAVGGIEQGLEVKPPGLVEDDSGLASVQPVLEKSLRLLRSQLAIRHSHRTFVCGELLVTGSTRQECMCPVEVLVLSCLFAGGAG